MQEKSHINDLFSGHIISSVTLTKWDIKVVELKVELVR